MLRPLHVSANGPRRAAESSPMTVRQPVRSHTAHRPSGRPRPIGLILDRPSTIETVSKSWALLQLQAAPRREQVQLRSPRPRVGLDHGRSQTPASVRRPEPVPKRTSGLRQARLVWTAPMPTPDRPEPRAYQYLIGFLVPTVHSLRRTLRARDRRLLRLGVATTFFYRGLRRAPGW